MPVLENAMSRSPCKYCAQEIDNEEMKNHVRSCKSEHTVLRSSPQSSCNFIHRHIYQSHQIKCKESLKNFLEDNSWYDDDLDFFMEIDESNNERVEKNSIICSGQTQEEDCPICLNDLMKNKQFRRLIPCNHGFCEKCIKTWFQYNSFCPVCKHSF